MTAPPVFATHRDYRERLFDAGFWQPFVASALDRHGLAIDRPPVAGVGGTYPTFICGDVVVKLFGGPPAWRKAHAAEHAVLSALATDAQIAAPGLVAAGRLCDESDAPWPYLITTRVAGIPWGDARLSQAQRLAVAADLGAMIRRVHALPTDDLPTDTVWLGPGARPVAAAAAQSSLPAYLVDQIDHFLAWREPFDPVFVHGDLMFRHVFVDRGRLTGVIDWGDAMATDRHYEFAKLHLDLFDGDKTLLRAFLDASDWPVTADFARRAMGQALIRQAHGISQHRTMDVFYKLPNFARAQHTGTLQDLAEALFGVTRGQS